MGVLKEIWTGELIKAFGYDKSFLGEIASRNEMVNNNVIHMVDVGADPEVLINNTTYPIAISGREDEDVTISLDKFDTENTRVTRDELYALAYDKMGSVIEAHKLSLEDKTADKAAHALAPLVGTGNSPIILTTGASNGETYARHALSPDDLIMAKRKLDDLKVPLVGRILVLCNQHIQELLKVDEVFARQYKDMATGQILNMYGFKLYQYLNTPVYAVVNGVLTKKAFGAVAAPSTDQNSSFFFYGPRAFQARGEVEMFYQDASVDPQYRQSVVGFRLYHICLPKKTTGFGAIVSDL
ncbi:MAG: hypothetical protein NT004_06225 [Bacteroidetes bacterium]|nr:hypothetical protein [Bacteroidota bacterium]